MTAATRRTGLRILTALSVLLALCGVARVLWVHGLGQNDFAQDYFAAKVLFEGGSIYGPEVVDRGRAHFGSVSPANYHPPSLIVLLAPLALLPYRLAFALLGLINVCLYILSLRLAARASWPASKPPFDQRQTWLLAALLWSPFWACLTHGQVSMMVAACVTASWYFVRRGRSSIAGVMAGLAVLIKLFPALISLYFLIRRDWRALASMALVITTGLAISVWVVGAEEALTYATERAPESAAHWSSHPLNVSIQSSAQLLLGNPTWGSEPWTRAPRTADTVALLACLSIFAATVYRGFFVLGSSDLGADRLFAGLCVVALLLSPLTWSHTLALALLPLAIELTRQENTRGRIWVLAVGLLLIGFPGPTLGKLVVPWFADGLIPWYIAAAFQAPALGLMILWWRLMMRDPQ